MENRLDRNEWHNGEKSSAGIARKQAGRCIRDGVFLGVLGVLAVAFLLWFLLGYRKTGLEVEITVDGALYGTYSL